MGDVTYGELDVQDAIPGGGRGSTSPLNEMVLKIENDPSKRGKATCIAAYAQKTAAGAAANVLRQRFGRNVTVRGFTFASRKVDTNDGVRTGLWVFYDPSQIIDGEWEKHLKIEKKRKDKIAADAKVRNEKAKQESKANAA